MFGALSFIYGTAVTALIAVVISVPVSIGIALFTTQVAPAWMKKWLVSLTDLVAVVPSVVFGLWGIIFLAPKLVGFYKMVSGWFHGLAGLGDIFGKAGAGRTVHDGRPHPVGDDHAHHHVDLPRSDRDLPADRSRRRTGAGRDSLGDDHRSPCCRTRMSGIVGAVMLGLGRAMGETIAVALVIGSSPTITANLSRPATRCPP